VFIVSEVNSEQATGPKNNQMMGLKWKKVVICTSNTSILNVVEKKPDNSQ
jgi:hypothetical protein